MSPEELAKLKKLARQYGITFNRLGSSSEWPSLHIDLFESITALGTVSAQSYHPVASNAYVEPWKSQTLRRAKRLAELASKCESEGKNEQSWRLTVEPEILSRFTIEVACPHCRRRIWRSEIEVVLNDHRALESLERRRRNRAACSCDPLIIGDQSFDHGVNPLFTDRADEKVHHEASLTTKLSKEEKPDRVYGLKSTKVFHKLLDRLDQQSVVGDDGASMPRLSPFREPENDILFPFLVLEAKSARSSDDFQHMQAQSAFTIRTLLQIQEGLADIRGSGMLYTFPLVWFLCNRGDLWKVSAAVVEGPQQNRSYKVFELWQGSINLLDNALQLLLIIDHIFDWARDGYRPSVIETLKICTQANTASLAETNCFSLTNDRIGNWLQGWDHDESTQSDDLNEQLERARPPLSYERWTHYKFGTVRDA
ncbi:MAG: hypothetical protein M1831_005625 [Alyxoria varia]|nr:MAG: hypothetical protein M1831_005625 [Alyxoria varia]